MQQPRPGHHRDTGLSRISSSKPHRDITVQLALMRQARPGHQFLACFRPASHAETPMQLPVFFQRPRQEHQCLVRCCNKPDFDTNAYAQLVFIKTSQTGTPMLSRILSSKPHGDTNALACCHPAIRTSIQQARGVSPANPGGLVTPSSTSPSGRWWPAD